MDKDGKASGTDNPGGSRALYVITGCVLLGLLLGVLNSWRGGVSPVESSADKAGLARTGGGKGFLDSSNLLQYGNSILDSLRPGMVYVGGTDPGRFIPTLLTETSGGDPHIVLTQNALADSRYLEYVQFLYGAHAVADSGRFATRF